MKIDDQTAIDALLWLLNKPTYILEDKDGNVTLVRWDADSYDADVDFHMKIDVAKRTVAVRVFGPDPDDKDTFLYHVDNLSTAYRIYNYFRLSPSEFAWDCGLVLHHDEVTGEWSATDENGTTLYREMDAFEVKSAIFETVTGLRGEGQ